MKHAFTLIIASLAAAHAVTATAATPSVNGASVFTVPEIIDAQGNAWTVASGVVQMNRSPIGYSANVNMLLDMNSVMYQRNAANHWYEWNGTSWPATSDPRVVSRSGSSISRGTDVLVDAGQHVWTLPTDAIAYRDGLRAASNWNTSQLVYLNGVIYSENGSHEWYAWSGANWTRIAGDPDPRGPHLVQYRTYTSPACPGSNPGCTPPFEGNTSVSFTQSTLKGDAIWVAATVSDYGGVHAITVTDSQGNAYHQLDQLNDGRPGAQSVASFYAANVSGGADTVTVNWSSDNYKGVVIAEIGGVTSTPLVGSAARIQDGGISAGSNNVASGRITVGSAATPALVVSLTMDTDGGGSDTGGTGFCAIPAGSGFGQVTQTWSWAAGGAAVCNLATFETSVLTAPGSIPVTFTTSHLSDPYLTVGAVFH
jgi:hypothetical protein